ncbi:hypothetical protein ACTJKN_25745 [Pedobacter sp. 22163]|uniref:hypothetical protein n=1 Tax=Pedobacter sp. 22163 TaxID=3453883 RepID=UPI003F877341
MNNYQISVRPRHKRYVFCVEAGCNYKDLYKLITRNQSLWGGRFNPIIPVNNNEIDSRYLDIVKHYDPDAVFYTAGIDIEKLKSLLNFNPTGYFGLNEKLESQEITGVSTFFFLTQFDQREMVLLPEKYFSDEDVLPKFYELNFGLSTTPLHHEYELSKMYKQVKVNEDFGDLNKIIHQNKPINFATLSKIKLNTKILRNLKYGGVNDFEIIIAKDDTQTLDLFYFWNRGLYQHKNLMYVTLEQLEKLSGDKFFGGVLYDLKGDHSVRIVSMSLQKETLDEIIEKTLRPIAHLTDFRFFDISAFPYEVLDNGGLLERDFGESVETQMLVSDNGLLRIPKLSFGDNMGFLSKNFAVDLKITQEVFSQQQSLLFPLTTDTGYIVKNVKGRVLLSRNLSVFFNGHRQEADALPLQIPHFKDLVRQLIQRPIVNGEAIDNKIIHVGMHDASNRVKAFIKIFRGDFREIYDYLSDRFWMDIFEELTLSEKLAGDSLTFNELVEKAVGMYRKLGRKLVDREQGWFNIENLQLGLKRTLQELTEYQVFFKGFKLKCNHCSSKFWYHINEVRDSVSCRGCLEDFALPIEPLFAYKLNDLIKNNIYATSKDRDGNLTVIRALATFGHSSTPFQYSPQLNLYDDIHSNKPLGDLDIVITENGKFVVGEAKHDAKGFFEDDMKSLRSLAELTRIIFPEKIILVASEDEKKLLKAANSMKWLLKDAKHIPEIKPMLLSKPDYWHVESYRYFKY